MTLDEFVAESHADIDRFKANWLKKQKADPEIWPAAMNPGDWFDQFMIAISTDESEETAEAPAASKAARPA